MLKQVNKYELTKKIKDGNTILFAKNLTSKLTSAKYILGVVAKGLRLYFKKFSKNRNISSEH